MTRLIWAGLLCAAWLSGCASDPGGLQPSGVWEDLNLPQRSREADSDKARASTPKDGGGRDDQGQR